MSYIGIDPAAESFVVSAMKAPKHQVASTQSFANSVEGIDAFEHWMLKHELDPDWIAVENTGVYSELLCYELHRRAFQVALLDPHTLSQIRGKGKPKNDQLDSQDLAEYALRFQDQLKAWRPHQAIVEEIKTLLATREQLVQQKTATQNARHALKRKPRPTRDAINVLEQTIAHLGGQIKQLETLIRDRIAQQLLAHTFGEPGIGSLSIQLRHK